MKPEPSIFDEVDIDADMAADMAADAEGLADLDAGRVISHEAMKAWLLSWGTTEELPPPRPSKS
jgi:predicted transcriptional regulator